MVMPVWTALASMSADRSAALMAVLLDSSSVPTDPVTVLLTYGPFGLVTALFITKQIRTKGEVEILERQVAKLEEAMRENARQAREDLQAKDRIIEAKDHLVEAFQMQLTGRTLPALARSASVLEAIPSTEVAAIEELRKSQQKTSDLISRLERMTQGSGEQ